MDPKDIYFVHIRRGIIEYSRPRKILLFFRLIGMSGTLIARVRTMNSDALFMAFSDEPVDCVEYFSACRNVIVVRGRLVEDLAVMSLCQGGGVLSARSFSWWAAYFFRRLNSDASFLAPLFWFGHPFGRWIPSRIKTDWMTCVEALN